MVEQLEQLTRKLNEEHAITIEELAQRRAALQQAANNATAGLGRLATALTAQAAMLRREYEMPDGEAAFGVENAAWVLVVTPTPEPASPDAGLSAEDPPIDEDPGPVSGDEGPAA